MVQPRRTVAVSTLPSAATKIIRVSSEGSDNNACGTGTSSVTTPTLPPIPSTCQQTSPSSLSTHRPEGIAAVAAQLASTEDLLQSMKSKAYQKSALLRSKPQQTKPPLSQSQSFQERRSSHSKGQLSNLLFPASASVPRGTHASTGSSHHQVKKQVDGTFHKRLEDQLSVLASTAQDIKQTFDTVYHRDSRPVASYTCKNFCVGTATATTSSRVDVSAASLDYVFYHPQNGKIRMVMRFSDMDHAELDVTRRVLRFHIVKPLHKHFGLEYDPHQHNLSFQFGNAIDARAFADCVGQYLPQLQVMDSG